MINNPDPNTWFDLFLNDVKYPVESDYFPDGSFSFRCNLPKYDVEHLARLGI